MEDILDILLDEENDDNIILEDEEGNTVEFEQLAVIPIDEKLYCILKPITPLDDMSEDEALVFYIDETVEPSVPVVETNEKVINKVFDEFYKLIEEA